MIIYCYSRNANLLEALNSLYGEKGVLVKQERSFEPSEVKNGDIVIVEKSRVELPTTELLTIPIIVLTEIPSFEDGFALLQRGVRGYGNLHMRQTNLQQAVEHVAGGQIWLPPDIVTQLIGVVGSSEKGDKAKSRDTILTMLSKREKEVALFVAQGMSNQEVAEAMYVSLRTVKAHLSSIYEKTGVRNRLELGLALG